MFNLIETGEEPAYNGHGNRYAVYAEDDSDAELSEDEDSLCDVFIGMNAQLSSDGPTLPLWRPR